MEDKVLIIMENVFECTLDMISKDFSEYPQHRVEFFKLLKAINVYCFPALLKLDQRQFKLVIDSCLWASKHDNREVESTGLTMCMELIDNMASSDPQTASLFFRQFFLPILQDVFFVLTDTDHKAGMLLPNSRGPVLPLTGSRLQNPVDASSTDVQSHFHRRHQRAYLFSRAGAARDFEPGFPTRLCVESPAKRLPQPASVSRLLLPGPR